jgi:hypothetical protein
LEGKNMGSLNRIWIATALIALILFQCLLVYAETSNQSTDSWSTKAPMHEARSGLGVIAVDGKIYAIGGTSSNYYSLTNVLKTNEQYDPVNDTWTYKTPMPTARAYFAIAAYQGKIYCTGGATGTQPVDYPSGFYGYTTVNVTEVYDTVNNTWETKAPLPVSIMQISAQAIDGKIYVMGAGSIYVYDIANNSWTNKGYIPTPRYSALIENKIFATGMHDVNYPPNSTYYGWTYAAQQVLTYDPITNNITQGSDGPILVDGTGVGATMGINAPQRLYVLGFRYQWGSYLAVNQAYDPKSDTWANATVMPTTRFDFGVAVVNDSLYAIGGSLPTQNSKALAVNEQYFPLGYGTLSTLTPSSTTPIKSDYANLSPFWVIPVLIIVAVCCSLFLFRRKRSGKT